MTKPWFPGSITVYPDTGSTPKLIATDRPAVSIDPEDSAMPPAVDPPKIALPPPDEWGTKRHGWGKKGRKIYARPPGRQYLIDHGNGKAEVVEPSPSNDPHVLTEEVSGLGFLDEIPDYVKYGALALVGVGLFLFIRSRKGGKKKRR